MLFRSLGQMLEQEGAEVFFAEDGNLAIELVRAQGATAFDVVLCDIEMPDLDGYATTQALHRLAPDLPVIGLTAHAFAAARQRGKMAGMVDYITKPYMLDTLVAAILQHTRRPVGPALPTMLHMTSSAQVADIDRKSTRLNSSH